jgi:hypothetical protein
MDPNLYSFLVVNSESSPAPQAHHAAFAATGGDGPDWSIWYADYLQAPFAEQLDMQFHKSQLIYCLMNADFEHQARSPDSDWSEFFADELLERCAVPREDGRFGVALPSVEIFRQLDKHRLITNRIIAGHIWL